MGGFISTMNNYIYSETYRFGLIEVLEYIIFIVFLYKYNPFGISGKNQQIITLFISLIYVLLFFFLNNNLNAFAPPGLTQGEGESEFLLNLLGSISFFLLSVYVIKFTVSHLLQGNFFWSLFRFGMLALIIIGAIALVIKMTDAGYNKLSKKPKGLLGNFVWNVILYLPCLFVKFVDYLKYEYNLTTKPIWLLLGAEVAFITLWYVVPLLLQAYSTTNGIQLLKAPVYLNNETTIGTFEELYGRELVGADISSADNTLTRFNYHYALSAWFYLNPQPPNTSLAYNKYTTILNYGGKPAIEFNGKLNSLRVLVESEREPKQHKRTVIFKTNKILYQTWNNIVLNYDRGTMDVFLNGELVGSKASIAPYMSYDNIQVGSDNGLQGGISNVMYFKDNLSRNYINMLYHTLRHTDEPFF